MGKEWKEEDEGRGRRGKGEREDNEGKSSIHSAH